jgi:septal ring factor EnvC (AmiA/AmiB activator)
MSLLNKITKSFLLNEEFSANSYSYSLQAIEDNLRSIRVSSKKDKNRISLALEQTRKMKSHLRKLEEKISHLEDQLQTLNEDSGDK